MRKHQTVNHLFYSVSHPPGPVLGSVMTADAIPVPLGTYFGFMGRLCSHQLIYHTWTTLCLLGRHHQFSFQLSTLSWVLGSHLSPREWACLSAHPPEELLRALPGRWGDPRPGLCRTYWQVAALWTRRVSVSLSLLLVFPTSALQASCTPPPTCQDLVAPLTFREYAVLLSSSVKSRSDPRPGCS